MLNTTLTGYSQSAYTRPVDPCSRTTATSAFVANSSAREWEQISDALRKLATLQDDWDGQGAVAPTHDIIQSAVEFAHIFRRMGQPAPTTAVATLAGTILFGWHSLTNYFEAEIVAPYLAEWMRVDEDGNATHGEYS